MPSWDEVPDIETKKAWDDVPDMSASEVGFVSSHAPEPYKKKKTIFEGIADWVRPKWEKEKEISSRPFGEFLKTRLKQQGAAYAGAAMAPSRMLTNIASAVAGAPALVLPSDGTAASYADKSRMLMVGAGVSPDIAFGKDNAKDYLAELEQTTGLNPTSNAVDNMLHEEIGSNPDLTDSLAAGSLAGDLATGAVTGPLGAPGKIANAAMFAAPALGQVEGMGADANATIQDKLLAAGGIAATTRLMHSMPAARAAEGIASTVRPAAAKALAVPFAGVEGAGLQLMNNVAVKNVAPDYDITTGVGSGAALGMGTRLGMGHIGTGGVKVRDTPDIYKILERASAPESSTQASMEFFAPQPGTAPAPGVRVKAPDQGRVSYSSTLDPRVASTLAQNPVMAGEFTPNVPAAGSKITLDTTPYPRERGSLEAPGPRLEQGFLDTRAAAIEPMLSNTRAKLRELEALPNPNRNQRQAIEVLRQSADALSDPNYMRNREVDFGAEPIPDPVRPSMTLDTGTTVVHPFDAQGPRVFEQGGIGQPVAPDHRTPSPFEVPRNKVETTTSLGQPEPLPRLINKYSAEGTMYGDNPTPNFEGRPDQAADRAVWQNRAGQLSDAMGFQKGLTEGPAAQIPHSSKELAYQYFEAARQADQAPHNAEFRANLRSVIEQVHADDGALRAIALLENMKREQSAAYKDAAPFKGLADSVVDDRIASDPFYLPRKVIFTEKNGDMPSFLNSKTGVLTPEAFQQRKIKWMIDDATGEKVLINLDDPAAPPPPGKSYVDATRAEIQNGSNITYLDDPFVAISRNTGQLRAFKRVGEIRRFTEEQSALGNDKPAQIYEDAFGSGRHTDPNAMDNFNRTVTNVGFLNPFIHAPNQVSHFVKQLGIKDLFGGGDNAGQLVQAMHEMTNYTPEFRQFLKAGGQSMRRNSYWKDIKGKMDEVLQSPDIQNELAREYGGNQNRLNQFVQEVASMPTWLLDDAMRFSLTKKQVVKNGGDWQRAVQEVDKSFPSYRLDTFATGGSGKGAKALDAVYKGIFKSADSQANTTDSPSSKFGAAAVRAVSPLFMKYRFGQWKSFMKMWGDTVKSAAHGDAAAMQAAGDKLGAVFFTKMVLLPMVSGVYNAALGDKEQGKKVKARSGGHQHAMEQIMELKDAALASAEEGSSDPFISKARQSAQQFAIFNPLVRSGLAGLGYDAYNNKAIEGDQIPAAVATGMPFGREIRSMTDYGLGPAQAFTGALLGKADKSPLEQYISRVKGGSSFPVNREKMKAAASYKQALIDGDTEAAAAYMDVLGGPDSPDVEKAQKYLNSTPEQRMVESLKSLQPNELLAAYGAADEEDKGMVHAVIASKVQNGKLNPFSMALLKNWLAKRGKQPSDEWINAHPWSKEPF